MIELVPPAQVLGARIKVVGVGGGGGNAVNTMIQSGLTGVEFIAANTDVQAIARNESPVKVQLGAQLTKGLGAGADPEIGRQAALDDSEMLRDHLAGADMVFVTAGMGGGTGTGGAPVVARIARELGALTVAVVTKPFMFEGKKRMRQADEGMTDLKDAVDTLIAIPNERLLAIAGRNTSLVDTFRKADDVLLQAVRGISDLITETGLINLDFADVRTIMSGMGMAMMGTGVASGENRAVEAAQKAISSPLLEDMSIFGAQGLLINITGSQDLSLHEVNEAASLIQREAHEDANIIFGAAIDERMGDEIRITVIATGFEVAQRAVQRPVVALAPPKEVVAPTVSATPPIRQSPARTVPRDASRPVVRMGTIIDNGESPTWQRPNSQPEAQNGKPDNVSVEEFTMSEEGDDQYEIPAFLRKNAGAM